MHPVSPRPEFVGTTRFEIVRVVGSGGMGVVYEVFDRHRNRRVALKALQALDAEARLRFKDEFRSLQDIQHPNLVSLGELQEEAGQLFFTMELVRGVNFIVHVRVHEEGDADPVPVRTPSNAPPPSRTPSWAPPPYQGAGFDEARLRAALAQLLRGLSAIHAAGKVHRDIKPSNVLVTAEGRVVILDFGLVVDAHAPIDPDTVAGTAHFVAPEQTEGKPVGPEADHYSVGVMLYLALTGTYPFPSSPKMAIDLKRRMEPPPPGKIVADLPPDLEALCVDLLRLDPAARPSGAELLRRLELDEEPPVLSQRQRFVGRQRELFALDEAFAEARAGRPVTVLLEGESGIGKSALARCFLERMARDALVLSGRCYERESVPYKAVDELVDALSVHLSGIPPDRIAALLPPDAGLLGAVFPVLRKVPAIVEAEGASRAIDPTELRTLVFAALRALFGKLSDERPVVLVVDDLQWADADGLALLAEIMRNAFPPEHATGRRALLLLAIIRSGVQPSPASLLRRLAPSPDEGRHLELGPMSATEAEALCAQLLRGAAGSTRRSIRVEALARESGGHPLFMDALIRYRLTHDSDDRGPVRLEEALWDRIARLDPCARELMELAAITGGPLPLDVAACATSADAGDVSRRVSILGAAHLVRTGGAARDEHVEPYHNRIRETVLGHLDADATRAWHGRLARAMESSGRTGQLEALAEHWRAAGDAERAAGYAVRAGAQAEAALAFDRAARQYRTAVNLLPRGAAARRAALARLGDALSSAGRGARAAEAYMAASDGAPADEALDLGRRAAESLLRAGQVDAGMAGLRKVLASVGLEVPPTPEQAMASLLRQRAQIRRRGTLFKERRAAEIPQAELARIDVCWSAALGLAILDPIRGADFQTRSLLLALEAGEPYRVARALAFEAVYVAAAGTPAAARVADLLEAARAVAERIDHPHALGLVHLSSGITSLMLGRFREAAAALDHADAVFRERCAGVIWERGTVHSFAITARWLVGDVRELARRVPQYLQLAEKRGDRYLATSLRSAHANAYWLLQGNPDAADEKADEAIRIWSRAGFHLQIYFDLVARAHIGLYRGEGAATHRLLTERWPALVASFALRIQAVRVSMIYLRGAAALAAARTGDRAALLEEADRAAVELEAELAPWSAPLVAALRAGLSSAAGDRERAALYMDEAARGFEAGGMALYAAAARRRLGEISACDPAGADDADRWMRAHGVVDPERMAAMLIPRAPA